MWICLLFAGCNTINPAEQIPAYIRIPSPYGFSCNRLSQGTANQRITDAWVYLDEQLVGVFELPATFPVLATGNHNVRIAPGIKQNGITATRVSYPFFTDTTFSVTLSPNQTTELKPLARYSRISQFKWLEDFESNDFTLERSGQSQVDPQISNLPTEPAEGLFCGKILLPPGSMRFECVSKQAYDLPKGGAFVYLELEYRINHPMVVGIYAYSGSSSAQFPVINLNPTVDSNGNLIWKKTYIYLTPEVSPNVAATNFRVFFGAQKNLVDESMQGVFYLDNIKVISP
jgi:hypothetical protein